MELRKGSKEKIERMKAMERQQREMHGKRENKYVIETKGDSQKRSAKKVKAEKEEYFLRSGVGSLIILLLFC